MAWQQRKESLESRTAVPGLHHLSSWIISRKDPVQVIETIILPTISRESLSSADSVNQSLLADIVQIVQTMAR